jgi:predicted permease
VTTACAFGNSLTLPLVFLMALLPGAAAERATGFLALFLIGWSPSFWSIAYRALASIDTQGQTAVAATCDTPVSPTACHR